MNLLRKLRITFALFFFVFVTLLFLDFTGSIHQWFGWMAKVQFLPAILALNVGIIIGLVALTLLFGRLYCSIICPLGVFQDIISRANRKRNKYSSSPALNVWRYTALGFFTIAIITGIGSFVALLAPYSSYGRIVSNLLAPIYMWGNNVLAYMAERPDSYMFYNTVVWIKSLGTFALAILTIIIIPIFCFRGGITSCNAIFLVVSVFWFIS